MQSNANVLSRFRQVIHDKRWYFLILILFWLLVIVIKDPFDAGKGALLENIYSNSDDGNIGEINENAVFEQVFSARHEGLKEIAFYAQTYGRANAGTLFFSLYDNRTEELIFEGSMDVSGVKDLSWISFEIPQRKDSDGKEYRIVIRSDSKSGSGITIGAGSVDDCLKTLLNGQEEEVSMCFRCSYYAYSVQILKYVLWILMILLSLAFVAFMTAADEKTFLKFIVFFGIIFVFLHPFPHALDESTHYFRSYMISQGDLIDETDSSGAIGGNVSDNYDEIIAKKLTIKTFLSDSDDWEDPYSDSEEFFVNPYMSSYVPIDHAAGAVGIAIGRAFHAPAWLVILLGRITSLAVYVVLAYFAIRKAKYYKNLFFIAATMPLSVILAGSYSADPLLIGGSLLFVSICLSYRFEPERTISKADMIWLLVCVVIIASSKYLIYTPVLLLFFMIPRKCFSKRLWYVLEIVAALFIIMLLAFAQLKLLGLFNFVEDRNGDVDIARQITFMLQNKRRTASVLLDNSIKALFKDFEFLYFHGIAEINNVLWWLILFAAACEKNKYEFENKKRKWRMGLLLLFIFFVSFGLTVLALYVGYNPVGSTGLDGVQARYILPILLMLLIPVSFIPAGHKIKNFETLTTFCMGIGSFNLIAGILAEMF